MALAVADRVKETSTTAGTGTLTLLGAVAGYQSFSVIGSGNTTYYCIVDDNTGEWEVGVGTYTSPNQLSRDSVLSSSSGGSAITFLGNIKQVFVTYPAERSVYENAAGSLVLSKVEATTGEITNLTSTSATITNLTLTSLVISNLSIASANITTLTSTNATAASLTVSTGNLTFSSTGQRITGDMSNATFANRLAFQTSTTNGTTTVTAIPNGTQNIAAFSAESDSAATNSSTIQIAIRPTTGDAAVIAGIRGTGTYLPMTFFTGGSERMRLDTSGNVGIGTASPTTYSGGGSPFVVAKSSSAANVIAASLVNPNNATNTAVSLDFVPNSNIALAQIQALRTDSGGGGVTDLRFLNYNASSLAETMRITGAGNVGIGNTAANVNDQVGSVRPLLVSTSDSVTTIAGSKANIVIGNADTTTNNTSQLSFAALTGANTTYFAAAAINCVFGARTNGQYPTGQLVFSTSTSLNSAPTEKMRIDSSGNVGIGTASPTSKLDVYTATASGGHSPLFFSANNSSSVKTNYVQLGFTVEQGLAGSETGGYSVKALRNNSLINLCTYDGAATVQAWKFFTEGSERMRILSDGSVIIGSTVSYGGLLSINRAQTSSIADLLTLRDGSAGTTFNLQTYGDPAAGTANRFNYDGAYLAFRRSGTEQMRLTSGGDFLVGCTANPSSSVVGVRLSKTATQGFGMSSAGGTGSLEHWYYYNPNGLVGTITTSGSATAYNTSSDRRLKENIAPADDAGALVDAIQIVKHDWKVGGHTRYGVVAQDLHDVVPEAVAEGDDGDEIEKTWGVDYSKLVPILVKEIQSLRARLAALEEK